MMIIIAFNMHYNCLNYFTMLVIVSKVVCLIIRKDVHNEDNDPICKIS